MGLGTANGMLALQNRTKSMAIAQMVDGFSCYYCGRTAQDLLDENVFIPRLYDTGDPSETNCFLCNEHGMYGDVVHIKDLKKKEECLRRFSIEKHRPEVFDRVLKRELSK